MGIGLESDLRQCLLDPEFGKSQKLRSYEKHLERKILSKQFTNNRQVYDDALLKGCLPRHAKDVLKRMKKEGKIQTVPNISYESIYKKKNIQQFEIV